MNSIPVILDVDTGIDDALALMLAARHSGLALEAVTCVGGNVPLPRVVQNTLSVLALAGAHEVPVAAGMNTPLIEPARDASYVHGSNGLADLDVPQRQRPVEGIHAVELLRQKLTAAAQPITLIALAPLTNIAMLLRMYPQVAANIERIVFMGGSVGPGNATAVAEFNIWHDPEAADIVVRSGIPMMMYGLEPFYRVCCETEAISTLTDSDELRPGLVGKLLRHLSRVTEDEDRIAEPGAAAIGDAGAVCAVIDPSGVFTRRLPVSVSLHSIDTRGQTIVDLRHGPGTAEATTDDLAGNVDVVLDVDAARYRDLFLEAVS